MMAISSLIQIVNVCCFAFIEGTKPPSKMTQCHPESRRRRGTSHKLSRSHEHPRRNARALVRSFASLRMTARTPLLILRQLAEQAPRYRRLQKFAPAQIVAAGNV